MHLPRCIAEGKRQISKFRNGNFVPWSSVFCQNAPLISLLLTKLILENWTIPPSLIFNLFLIFHYYYYLILLLLLSLFSFINIKLVLFLLFIIYLLLYSYQIITSHNLIILTFIYSFNYLFILLIFVIVYSPFFIW